MSGRAGRLAGAKLGQNRRTSLTTSVANTSTEVGQVWAKCRRVTKLGQVWQVSPHRPILYPWEPCLRAADITHIHPAPWGEATSDRHLGPRGSRHEGSTGTGAPAATGGGRRSRTMSGTPSGPYANSGGLATQATSPCRARARAKRARQRGEVVDTSPWGGGVPRVHHTNSACNGNNSLGTLWVLCKQPSGLNLLPNSPLTRPYEVGQIGPKSLQRSAGIPSRVRLAEFGQHAVVIDRVGSISGQTGPSLVEIGPDWSIALQQAFARV